MIGVRDPGELNRRPFRFAPRSGAEPNYERLPAQEAWKAMELAYWQDLGETTSPDLARWLAGAYFVVILLSTGSLFAGPLLKSIRALLRSTPGADLVAGVLGVLIALIVVVAFICFLDSSGRLCVGTGVLSLVLSSIAISIAPNWTIPITLLLIPAVHLATRICRNALIDFAQTWLLANPRLSRPERDRLRKFWAVPQGESWRNAGIVPLTIIVLCCGILPSACLLGEIAAGGIAAHLIRRHMMSLRSAAPILFRFLTYSGENPPAPGVFIPNLPLHRRINVMTSACLLAVVAALLAVVRATGGNSLLSFGHGLITGLVLVPVFVLALLRDALLRVAEMAGAVEASARNDNRTWWERHVERARASEHVENDPLGNTVREAEHIFLGIDPHLHIPILLHQALLCEHAYIVGRSGSGKTSMGLTTLLISVIRGHALNGGWSPKSPVVILDFKGDEVLFQTAREEARRRGQVFQFFTLENWKASHKFNPFRGFDSKLRSLPQLAQLVLDSLSLNHGPGYGRGYFSQQSRMLLSETLMRAKEERYRLNSFKDLYDRLLLEAGRGRKSGLKDAFELVASIEALTHYPQLVTTQAQEVKNPDGVIQMDRVLSDSHVVYFWLPAAMESISVREVGKLVLFNLQTAAFERFANPVEKDEVPQVYLFIDECQKVAGENFRTVLQLARSAKIGTILANQSLEDLNLPDSDLRSAVKTNTRSKMFFSVNGADEAREIVSFREACAPYFSGK